MSNLHITFEDRTSMERTDTWIERHRQETLALLQAPTPSAHISEPPSHLSVTSLAPDRYSADSVYSRTEGTHVSHASVPMTSILRPSQLSLGYTPPGVSIPSTIQPSNATNSNVGYSPPAKSVVSMKDQSLGYAPPPSSHNLQSDYLKEKSLPPKPPSTVFPAPSASKTPKPSSFLEKLTGRSEAGANVEDWKSDVDVDEDPEQRAWRLAGDKEMVAEPPVNVPAPAKSIVGGNFPRPHLAKPSTSRKPSGPRAVSGFSSAPANSTPVATIPEAVPSGPTIMPGTYARSSGPSVLQSNTPPSTDIEQMLKGLLSMQKDFQYLTTEVRSLRDEAMKRSLRDEEREKAQAERRARQDALIGAMAEEMKALREALVAEGKNAIVVKDAAGSHLGETYSGLPKIVVQPPTKEAGTTEVKTDETRPGIMDALKEVLAASQSHAQMIEAIPDKITHIISTRDTQWTQRVEGIAEIIKQGAAFMADQNQQALLISEDTSARRCQAAEEGRVSFEKVMVAKINDHLRFHLGEVREVARLDINDQLQTRDVLHSNITKAHTQLIRMEEVKAFFETYSPPVGQSNTPPESPKGNKASKQGFLGGR